VTGKPPDRAQLISDLCDSWVAATTGAGGIQIGTASETFRLRNNGLEPHDFTYSEVRAACIGLTRVLLLPGLNTIIDFDHQLLWAWCAEVLIGSHGQFFDANEREVKSLLGLACRASLAGVARPDKSGFEERRRQHELMEPNARELVNHAHEVLSYLSFPLLEGVLRKVAKTYITYDGVVLVPFQGKNRKYEANDRCSNLGDLLRLLEAQIAGPDLRQAVDDLKKHLQLLDPGKDAFDIIFDWRNSSLHGEARLPTIGGTVLSMTLVIALDQIQSNYDALRTEAMKQIAWEVQTASFTVHRSPWAYYPPWI
jgi:hypothetical protein